jgi:hypothetical protein
MVTQSTPSQNTSNTPHYMPIVWLKRAYINPFSNASDIGKTMKHQGFASKSPLD